jgi:hypothetical protein
MKSSNGIDWATYDTGYLSTGPGWSGLCWSGSQYVATQDANTAGTNKCAATSPNAIDWTFHDTPGEEMQYSGIAVCYSPDKNLYVAVGRHTTRYSSNGSDWTLGTWAGGSGDHGSLSVSWVPSLNLFIAAGAYHNGVVATSSDGITFTDPVTESLGAYGGGAVTFSSKRGLLVVGGVGGGTQGVAVSFDGVTWVKKTTPNTGILGLASAESPDVIVGVGILNDVHSIFSIS